MTIQLVSKHSSWIWRYHAKIAHEIRASSLQCPERNSSVKNNQSEWEQNRKKELFNKHTKKT